MTTIIRQPYKLSIITSYKEYQKTTEKKDKNTFNENEENANPHIIVIVVKSN